MANDTKKLGMLFTASAWILAFAVMALAFSEILDRQNNPNRSVATLQTGEYDQILLERNRRGHYLFDGEINGQPVTLLVDTGATVTAIPGELAAPLGLERGPPATISTANGRTTAYLTRLDRLAIGAIELRDVDATLIDGMGVDEVLLGMNVLRDFELVQRGETLILRRYR